MAVLELADVLECTTYCRTDQGQNQCNVVHFRVATISAGSPTVDELASPLADELADAWTQVLPSTHEFQGVKLRRISDPVTAVYDGPHGPVAGSLAGDPLPNNCAPLISLRAVSAPPRIRGRIYLPSPTVNELSATGAIAGAFIATMAAAFAPVFLANLPVTFGGITVNVRGVIWAASLSATYDITQLIPRSYYATQDRRRNSSQPDAPAF